MSVLKKYVFIESLYIGYIQNKIALTRFTSPFPNDSIRWKGMKVEALVSIADGWSLDSNLTEIQVEIPIKTSPATPCAWSWRANILSYP